jgi:dihydrofolate reductase
MRKLIESTLMTLDGVISNPQNWSSPYWDDDHTAYAGSLMRDADALVLGRVTYEGFADAWPEREGDPNMGGFAKKMNTMPKYVYSTTLESADWQNTTVLAGDFAADIAKVKEEVDGVILVAGSARLVRGLIAADLLDELRLMVFPVILGGGKRLFAEDGRKVPLALTDARAIGVGIQLVTYERTAA